MIIVKTSKRTIGRHYNMAQYSDLEITPLSRSLLEPHALLSESPMDRVCP